MDDTTVKTLDDFGLLTVPGMIEETLKYDLQGIAQYCDERGIKPIEMSKEALETFRRKQ